MNATSIASWTRQESPVSRSALAFDFALIWCLSLAALVNLILWYDNAQGITGNGIFKAMQAKPWIRDPASAQLDPSNYLYFPVIGRICWLFDFLGVFPGDPRRQIPFISAMSASACLVLIYILILHITGDRVLAIISAAFHLAGAFFLRLAISNEDIMPSYALMLSSMVLGSMWFTRPSFRRVAIVSSLFTLGWLFEWRLMFPTLPAMLLALALAPCRPAMRIAWAATFLATSFVVVLVIQALWGPQPGNPGRVLDLIWTAKGTNTGYAGFAMNKIGFLWVGIGESLLGGQNVADLDHTASIAKELVLSSLIVAMAGIGAVVLLWRNRSTADARVLAAIFGGTFAVGELMNLYSQPQDPQMQINVLPWLTVAVALIASELSKRRKGLTLVSLALASACIASYNTQALAATRGEDGRWREALARIEREVDPANTFLLVYGFDALLAQIFYYWDGQWNFFDTLGPAPTPLTKFKYLGLVSGPVNHPKLTGPELAAQLEAQIYKAMNLGYDVVAVDVWGWGRRTMASALSTVADEKKSDALYDMLHAKFVAKPIYTDPVAGQFVRLEPISTKR